MAVNIELIDVNAGNLDELGSSATRASAKRRAISKSADTSGWLPAFHYLLQKDFEQGIPSP